MLIVTGTNHKYSPIGIRERLSFSKKKIREGLLCLGGRNPIRSAVILSTCNRVEIYAHAMDVKSGIEILKESLSARAKDGREKIEKYLYTYIGEGAIRHLFSVAAGLDSQVIGEPQILGQVQAAYAEAKSLEVTDSFLGMIFEKAIETALSVRNETGISKGDISIATVAMELIREKHGSVADKRVMIIGIGKVSELVIKELKKGRAKTIFVSNRTYERARELASYIGGEAVGFDSLKERLKEVDIIISATSSPHVVLKKEDVLEAIDHRLLIIDLAVPRDVDEKVKEISGVELFSIDDLSFLIKKKSAERVREVPKAAALIEKEIETLCQRETLESGREPALLR